MLTAQALQPVLVGLTAGLIVAFWAARFLERFLFDVRTVDPPAYVAAAAWVLTFALVACVVPSVARRAVIADRRPA